MPRLSSVSSRATSRRARGDGTDWKLVTFNAGPDAIEALFSDALDLTFIGPNPAINGFAQSHGEALRIISGSTSGGASLVVRPGITGPGDLVGTRIATPQLGNTQDVALRSWLLDQGLTADHEGGGDVIDHPSGRTRQTLETFLSDDIDGAWVPEPWASRLVLEGGGVVLVDERDLWPDGRFVTTHLIVAHRVPRRAPRLVSRRCSRALVDRSTSSSRIERGAGSRQPRHRDRSPGQPLPPGDDRTGVAEPDVHRRSDRTLAPCVRRPRGRRRAARAHRPLTGHLRTRSAQRGARRSRGEPPVSP